MPEKPYWETTPLEAMSNEQWEALCDGCGLCCLNKLEDEDSGEIYLTRVACNLLDTCTAQCRDYTHRFEKVPDCVQITPEIAKTASWLPSSCTYRLLAQGEHLPWWHPLITGDSKSVQLVGVSVAEKVIHEDEVGEREYVEFIISEEELIATRFESE